MSNVDSILNLLIRDVCFRQKSYWASFRAEHQLTKGWPKLASWCSWNSTHMKINIKEKKKEENIDWTKTTNNYVHFLDAFIYKRSIVRRVSERFWIVCCACSACSSWSGISSWHLRNKWEMSEGSDRLRYKVREANQAQESLKAHSRHDRTFCGRLKLVPNSAAWSLMWVFDKHLEEEASVAYPGKSSLN